MNFTLAAYYALEDGKMLHSNKDKLHLFERTRELPGAVAAAAAAATTFPLAPQILLGTIPLLVLLPVLW